MPRKVYRIIVNLLTHIFTAFSLFASCCTLHAQLSLEPTGARAAGMGNIITMQTDVWAAVNNPAGLGMLTGAAVGISHEQRFTMQEMGVSTIAGAFPLWGNGVGCSLSNFGFTDFGENRFGIAAGRQLSPYMAVGVSVDGHLMRFPGEYKNLFAINGNAGVWAMPAKNFTLGLHIFNLTFSKWNDYEKTKLPVIFSLGAGYSLAAPVQLLAEISKNIYEAARIKAGTEFIIGKALYLRTGIITQPFEIHFGLGYTYKKFLFDAALSRHPVLGYTSQAAINISL
ncbi:MAG: hypothetical protein LBN98_02955 [Prevotellaceae bacterium]|nr:hypothetical protein [Prevotellaceae bacterium]